MTFKQLPSDQVTLTHVHTGPHSLSTAVNAHIIGDSGRDVASETVEVILLCVNHFADGGQGASREVTWGISLQKHTYGHRKGVRNEINPFPDIKVSTLALT